MPASEDVHRGPATDEREVRNAELSGKLLARVAAGTLDTVQEKVAWILNNYPDSRDSDIGLQIAYWRQFESYEGGPIYPDDLYRLPRLTTLTRARAKIQNDFKLFRPSAEVAAARGTLEEHERERAGRQRVDQPVFAVYADESGKTGSHLIVSSVWFAHGPETFTLAQEIRAWREARSYAREFHFQDISSRDLDMYMDFAELFLARATTVSFKAIVLERLGLASVETAFEDLYHWLLVRGIQHEDGTGRAPLPRSLQMWKDLEERSQDSLMLARLKERLALHNGTHFAGRLEIDRLEAVDSRALEFIQVADLFGGAINRRLNSPTGNHAKDEFARFLLSRIGIPDGPNAALPFGDRVAMLAV